MCNNCSASRLPKAMAGSSSDFEKFNKQTDDAWDGGDDDLLLEAFNVRISRQDVQLAATQVFNNNNNNNNNNGRIYTPSWVISS